MQSAPRYWSDRMEFKTNFMEAGVSATLPSDLPKKSFFFLAMNCYFVKKKSKNLALN